MRILFIILIGFFYAPMLNAQNIYDASPDNQSEYDGIQESDPAFILDGLNVKQDPLLESMLKWHIENNKKRDGIQGFRVEIFNSSAFNAREQAFNKKKEFISRYGEYNVHVKYTSPIFRVRVGDYRTKNEALKLHKKILADYPGAFIVSDVIDFPILKPEKL